MNRKYLRKFTDSRFDNFQFGEKVERQPYFYDGEVTMNLVDLERNILSGKGTAFEKLLFHAFDMVEAIHRVDFNSKYTFHSFTPKARNIVSLKVLIVYEGKVYSFHPLTNNIYSTANTFFHETSHNPMLLIVSDNRMTQYYYGEFNQMLSKLNVGHALFNVEYALDHIQELRDYKQEVYVKSDSGNFTDDPNVSITVAVEIQLNGTNMSRQLNAPSDPIFVEKIVEVASIPQLPSVFKGLERDSFRRRSSDQRKDGDVIFYRQLPEKVFQRLLEKVAMLLEGIPMKLYLVLNDIENWKPGYYMLHKNRLKYLSETQTSHEHIYIMKEYQTYTNLQGFNLWTFLTIEDSDTVHNHTPQFIQMGMIMQFISVFMATEGYAVRCLKNYDDPYIKSRTFMGDNEVIGYSSVIIPNHNHSISVQVNNA